VEVLYHMQGEISKSSLKFSLLCTHNLTYISKNLRILRNIIVVQKISSDLRKKRGRRRLRIDRRSRSGQGDDQDKFRIIGRCVSSIRGDRMSCSPDFISSFTCHLRSPSLPCYIISSDSSFLRETISDSIDEHRCDRLRSFFANDTTYFFWEHLDEAPIRIGNRVDYIWLHVDPSIRES